MPAYAVPVDYGNDIMISCQQNAAYIETGTVFIGDTPALFNE